MACRKACGVTCLARSVGMVSAAAFTVGGKLEPDARGAERLTIAIDEQPLLGRPWLPFKQFLQQHHGFRPERADTFLPPLAGQTHAVRAIEPDCFGTQVERFRYSCPAVVEEREQRMIPHAFNGRTVRLAEDRRHFRRIQIARFRHRSSFDRDMEDFDALRDRCGIPGGHEVEEAADRGQPAVARPDRTATVMFGVTEERGDLAGGQIDQRDHSHLFPSALGDEPQQQPPGIAV